MRCFKGIAALLMLILAMPLSHACAAVSCGAKVQQGCPEQHNADSCCKGPSTLCCTAQAPADVTPYSGQTISPLASPTVTAAVAFLRQAVDLKQPTVALHRPAQHPPPGLMIAETTVFRI